MNTIGVNISANKSLASCAEELLTRNPQFIHELCTELFTFAKDCSQRAKRPGEKEAAFAECSILVGCLTSGWRAAIQGEPNPCNTAVQVRSSKRIQNLTRPFTALGYTIGCRLIDRLITKGHHISCAPRGRHGVDPDKVDGTQDNTAPGPS